MRYADSGQEVAGLNIAMAKRSYQGNPHCGDGYASWEHDGIITLCIIDGLGHGVRAEEAAQAAERYVGAHLAEPLSEIFSGCDADIRHSRGVVMGIAVVDENQGTITYREVGNTSARIIGGGYKTLNIWPTGLTPSHVFIMHTDGITQSLDVSGYTDLHKQDLTKPADTILDDWGRDTDDAAIVIYRYQGRQQ